ncbi:MAG: FAD-dependent oxidoreductase [Leifsonia sp.]
MDEDAWELVVIGGGSAGLIAARTARLLGGRVLLVERDRLGGDCLWTGCVPSKALIAEARAAAAATRVGTRQRIVADTVFRAVNRARDRIAPTDSVDALERIGVTVRLGRAEFVGPSSLRIDGEILPFRNAVIATGSEPFIPDVPGLRDARPVTSDSVWDLAEIPKRLLVLGAGAVGCELGQAFARLGSDVTVVHRADQILPGEDSSARTIIHRAMETDGVRILTGRQLSQVDASQHQALLDDGSRIGFDRILVAAGRRPRVDGLELERAGVRVDAAGWVIHDHTMRTTNRSVWAAGDVAGLPKHTHTAGLSGATVARNALLGSRKKFETSGEAGVLFTTPEVATVGVRPDRHDPSKHRVLTMPHRHVDRAIADDDTSGFTKIVIDRRGRILGGTIVGPRAGETLGELAVAVGRRLTVTQLAGITHPYPTYNDGLWNAVLAESQRRIREGAIGRVAGVMRRTNTWMNSRRDGQ